MRDCEDAEWKRAEKNRNDFPVLPGPRITTHLSSARFLRRTSAQSYDLMVFEAASQVTGFWRKNDSFAM